MVKNVVIPASTSVRTECLEGSKPKSFSNMETAIFAKEKLHIKTQVDLQKLTASADKTRKHASKQASKQS